MRVAGTKTLPAGHAALLGALGIMACASLNGTPMRGSEHCRYVPSVEDCQAVADRIEELCLRDCVVHMCRVGRPICNETVQLNCVQLSSNHKEGQTGGYVLDGPKD